MAIPPSHCSYSMEYSMNLIPLLDSIVINPSTIAVTINGENPLDIITDAHIRLETLLRLYYLRHGVEYQDAFLLHFLVFVGNAALERLAAATALDSGERVVLRSTVVFCAKGLYDQGHNAHIPRVRLQVLHGMMAAVDVELLGRFVADGGGPSAADDATLRAQHVRLQWPWPIIKMDEDPATSQLGNLLRVYREASA